MAKAFNSRLAMAGMMAASSLTSCALAGWGLKFEVRRNNSDPWVSSLNARALPGKIIKFRFGVYFDVASPPAIETADGFGTAKALTRFTGSNQATGFAAGDVFQNVQRTISNGGAALVQLSGATIGTTTTASFGSQVFLGPVPLEPYKEVYIGEVKLGSDTTPRTITIKNKTFGSGSARGLAFYNNASPVNNQSGVPTVDQHVNLEAIIHVGVEDPCPSDLNVDAYVDGPDFVVFAAAYELLSCEDPAMPAGCPSDLNSDGFVDEPDFQMFALAYGELICP